LLEHLPSFGTEVPLFLKERSRHFMMPTPLVVRSTVDICNCLTGLSQPDSSLSRAPVRPLTAVGIAGRDARLIGVVGLEATKEPAPFEFDPEHIDLAAQGQDRGLQCGEIDAVLVCVVVPANAVFAFMRVSAPVGAGVRLEVTHRLFAHVARSAGRHEAVSVWTHEVVRVGTHPMLALTRDPGGMIVKHAVVSEGIVRAGTRAPRARQNETTRRCGRVVVA
jgi:hypothetical protein